MPRPLSFVRLDIARFGIEISDRPNDADLAKWIRSFHRALVLQDQEANQYAGELLKESQEFSEIKRNAANKRWSKDMQVHAGALQKSDVHSGAMPDQIRSDQIKPDQSIEDPPPKKGDLLLSAFDEARAFYPGTKRGLSIEWLNFTKKHPGYSSIVPLLLPAITREREHKAALKAARAFCPEWKNFGTWINQSCWTQEFPTVEASNGTDWNHPLGAPMRKKAKAL